jgi:L-ascorbate metabolism protein UlaG (beta-lactamase superfamily)
VRLTYVGHATLLIEAGGARVLTDPVLRARVAHLRRMVAAPAVAELLPLDAILVSHAHRDHLDLPSLRQVAAGCAVIAPRGTGSLLRDAGAREVVEVEAGDRIAVGATTVEAVPAVHDGRRHPLARRVPALGYTVSGVYFAGDTDLFEEMTALAGRVDVAALPVWGWGRRVGAGHLDPEAAARAVALIGPAVAVPIHWGTLRAAGTQRGADPLAPARKFAQLVARLAPATEVRVLLPGESFGSGDAREARFR